MQINFYLKLCIIVYYKQNKMQKLPSFQTNFPYSTCRKMLYTNDVRMLSQPVFDNYEIHLTCTVMRLHVLPAQNCFSVALTHWYSKEPFMLLLSLAYFQITGISFTIFVCIVVSHIVSLNYTKSSYTTNTYLKLFPPHSNLKSLWEKNNSCFNTLLSTCLEIP